MVVWRTRLEVIEFCCVIPKLFSMSLNSKLMSSFFFLFFHIGTWRRDTKHSELGCGCVVMSSALDHKALF